MPWNGTATFGTLWQRSISAKKGLTDKPDRGKAVVSLPELRNGNIGLVVGTQIGRYVAPDNPLPGWHSPEQAWAQTQGQLAWYKSDGGSRRTGTGK